MKTSTKIISQLGIADYHFAVQLNDRTWVDKPGGEKGDARRPVDRSNKRHLEIVEPNVEFEYTSPDNDIVNGVVIVAASLAIIYCRK